MPAINAGRQHLDFHHNRKGALYKIRAVFYYYTREQADRGEGRLVCREPQEGGCFQYFIYSEYH
jgi:hypothetical protein